MSHVLPMKRRRLFRIGRGLLLFIAGMSLGVIWERQSQPNPGMSGPGPQATSAPIVLPEETEDSASAEEITAPIAVPNAPDENATPESAISNAVVPPSRARINEFQGDEISLVLRTLARQAKMNVMISDRVVAQSGTVTARLEDKTPRDAIEAIVKLKGLVLEESDGIFYIKTVSEAGK
jgi:hypothetical protein